MFPWCLFLKEISSLSHTIVFLYFFALITEEGFLISHCYSLELCIKGVYFSFSSLPFTSFLFSAICKASSDNHFAFLHLFFLGMVLIIAFCTMSRTSVHSSSGTLSDLIPWISLSLPCITVRDRMISVHFQGKPLNITVIHICAPTRNAEEAEVEQGLIWRPTRSSGTNTLKICPFHYWGLECKSRNSRDTWSNVQVWPWVVKQSRSKANKRKCWS